MSEKVYMGNEMKRLIPLFLTLLCLCSCQAGPEPLYKNDAEEAAYHFLEKVRDFDTDAAEQMLLLQPDEVFFLAMDDATTELYDDVCFDTKNLGLYFQYAAPKMTFRITSSQISGDTATVKAYVKLVDGSGLLTSAYGGYQDACIAASLNNQPMPELSAHVDEAVLNAVYQGEPAMAEMIAEFTLTNLDGTWRIHSDPSLCPLFTARVFVNPDVLKTNMKEVGLDLYS